MGIRGGFLTNTKAKESRVTAVITRADGSIERLGEIAYWHRNPLRRWAWHIAKFCGSIFNRSKAP